MKQTKKNTAELTFPYKRVVEAHAKMAPSFTHYLTDIAYTSRHFKAIATL